MNEDFKIIRNAVSQELCEFLALEFNMMEDVCKTLYPESDLSDFCKNSFARYAPLMFEALSVKLLPLVEEAVGMKLWPSYSFARIYYTGSELQKHVDRPSSEITISVCITHDDTNWPLKIQGTDKQIHEIFLNVGDLVIYSGRKNMHWRDPFQGTKQIQAFLQYVDANGPDAWLKWDSKPKLGLGFDWARPEVQGEIKRIAAMESLIKNSNQN
jgi:hypothetical protein